MVSFRLSDKDRLMMLLCAAATFFVSLLFALRGVDPQHQGFLFKTAVDVSRGMTLFSETFTQYGSLPIYFFALCIRLFGETVAVINAATCLVYAGCAAALYALVRRYTNAVVAVFSTMLSIGMAAFYFWNFHPWPSVFALLFSLTAALSMVRLIDTRKLIHAFLCGVSTAAMFWCRQPQGLSVLAGVCVLIGLRLTGYFDRRMFTRSLLLFLAGNLAVHAAFLSVVMLQGALSDWWTQMIVNAFAFAFTPDSASNASGASVGVFHTVFVGLTEFPQFDYIWQVLTYGTLLYFIVLLVRTIVRIRRRPARTASAEDAAALGCIAFAAFALFNWPHYYPTLCYRHVFWADYPMFGVLCVALYQLASLFVKAPRKPAHAALLKTLTVVVAMTLLCSTNLFMRARIGKSRLVGGGNGSGFTPLEEAEEDTLFRYENARYGYLNGLYLSARETRFYDALFAALGELADRYPDKNVVNLTDNALFSVFGTENPHLRAFDNDPREFHYPEQMDVTTRYIREHRPIVLSNEPLSGYRTYAYIDEFNGDFWRYKPFYVLEPTE